MRLEFAVSGMHCQGCENSIIKAVSKLKNVESVSADHKTSRTVVQIGLGIATAEMTESIRAAIDELGFEAQAL